MKTTFLIATIALLFNANIYAQSTMVTTKERPTVGVYTLAKAVTGTCLESIKVYYSAELDHVDILGLHRGEVVMQLSDINDGKKTFAIRDEKKEVVGMQTSTSSIKAGSLQYEFLAQNKYGYFENAVKLSGNFNSNSISFAGKETNTSSNKMRVAGRLFSCLYEKK